MVKMLALVAVSLAACADDPTEETTCRAGDWGSETNPIATCDAACVERPADAKSDANCRWKDDDGLLQRCDGGAIVEYGGERGCCYGAVGPAIRFAACDPDA